jgi:diaminopimelate epimerase
MKFAKYHALGNDYIVIDPADLPGDLDQETIRLICHRHYGIGSDGILLGPLESDSADFGLRVFNPDGSEAQTSGNGLRIFARFLLDDGCAGGVSFTVQTPGGIYTCDVSEDGRSVTVQMGRVTFDSRLIPVAGRPREVLNEIIEVDCQELAYCAASVGNPHCVVLCERPSPEIAQRLGPLIESDSRFPDRTNVQFMQVLDRGNVRIEIWERGAGYTLASGSSSTAAAAVAHRLGLCDERINVHMPGGTLNIQFDGELRATMSGPVKKVCSGIVSAELFKP